MDLDVRLGLFAVCRWQAAESVPEWVHQGDFVSITRTPTELSVVCAFHAVPPGTVHEGPWRMFAARGPLDFALTGVPSGVKAGSYGHRHLRTRTR